MKNYIPFTLVFIFLLGTSLPLKAQFPRVLRQAHRKAHQKAEQAADKAIDRAIEKKIEEAYGEDQETRDVEVRGDTMIVRDQEEGGEIVITESDEPVEATPSEFIGSFVMEFESYKKGKLEKDHPLVMHYHIDTYSFAFEMQQEQASVMIVDRKNRTMTTKIDNDGNKMAVVMPLKNYTVETNQDEDDYSVTETGNTRQIEGYTCYEYLIETPTEKTNAWVARELDLDLMAMMDMVKVKNKGNPLQNYWRGKEGAVLLAETQVKGKDENRIMRMKDIQSGTVDQEVFSLEGYRVQKLPSMGRRP